MQQAYRTALITGASGGIGESFARELAARGAALTVVARRTDRLETLAEELRDRHRVQIEVLGADLADPEQLGSVEKRLTNPEHPVELLVNNAGFGTTGPFAELPIDGEDREIRVNVLALSRLTHAVLPSMIERRHGGVLNVSSVVGETSAPNNATYCASKSFVTNFTQGVHGEVRDKGVHVTALLPGFTRTEFQRNANFDTDGIPGFLWQEAPTVVREALYAVSSGRAVCIPGLHNKPTAALMRMTPRSLLRSLSAQVAARR